MKTNYPACIKKVLVYEGGKVNNPKDPGGKTNQGVIQRVFTAYLARKGKANRDVYTMTDVERDDIYRRQYWDAVKGDDLPAGVDLVVFDFAVNSGPGRAAKFLQKALGVKQDGNIGVATLHAATTADRAKLIAGVCDARLAWLRGLKTFATFGKGWASRVRNVKASALAMK